MNEHNYQVVQAIAGRTRIRIPWLKTNEEAAGKLQRLVESLAPVTGVRINPLAQSIIIFYRASAIAPKDLEAQVASAIQQANPIPASPGSPAPSSAPAPEEAVASTPAPTSTPAAVIESAPASAPGVAQPVPEAASAPHPPGLSSVEIPSPWDEPSEQEVKPAVKSTVEPTLEQLVPDEADPELEPVVSKPAPIAAKPAVPDTAPDALPSHSTTSLAKRLNTTSQAITHRRNRADFPTWTQSQDPERIAWKYNAASQSFEPVDLETLTPAVPPAIAVENQPEVLQPPPVEVVQPASKATEEAPEPTQRKTIRKTTKTTKANRRSSRKG